MNKTIKIYIGILALLFIGAVVFEVLRPKPIDWSPTFNEKHSIPYGLKVLHDQLPDLLPNDSVTDVHSSAYEFLDSFYEYRYEDSTYAYTINGNYLYIKNYFDVDNVSIDELLNFAAEGNTIFISSEYFPAYLSDTLNFKLDNKYDFKGEAKLVFYNENFSADSIHIKRGLNNVYFSKLDSLKTTALGTQTFDEEHINFVKIEHGNGAFLLHTQPYVFTNYHLLKDDHYQYTEAVLSYLPDAPVFFDSVNKTAFEMGNSPLRFIFSQPALHWAWLLSLLFIITFMLFNAKRRQRIIRIIQPLQNTTVQFTKTVANLYYETKDHSNIIDKKITFFLERIRSDYHLNTQQLDEKFIHQLALKSGNSENKVKKLVDFILLLKRSEQHSEQNLIDLNKHIEDFYQRKE
ncbi:DUF4350 domain-containing protein [Galbibacter sp. EGI 63066]|uniref:DUF4350 domain-containing protein n=1 Tax=Galbibacter sp. EGI 63066 TaxID=2993559 RepID=UPI0022495EC4|nr:DUF4350 domain-containing protein [Galbibacter sp. EGI 63066]MCX2681454.1 DUF4350 domain-containing protein [Galbibacter sp. EGI 63066]